MGTVPSDADLIRRVVARDDEALLQLYQRYGRAVFALGCYITQDRATAEEITQDAFVALWQKAHLFDSARGRVDSWLLQIARNLAIDCLRHQQRHMPAGVSLDGVETHAAPPSNDAHGELHTLLRQLPTAQRQVIELAYFQGYTHEEIAAQLGLPLGTVKSRILLGLRRLHNLLQ
ncbi:MAG: sigma-70 family RNA polymerase sigma factor [Chloroflexota bacterium]